MIVILGPTASGKTQLAAHSALRLDGEILSADSRQVYRRMDIGTGKDLSAYVIEGKCIKYHLIDILEPGTKYNINEYFSDFEEAVNNIRQRKKVSILCGGSGLYLQTALEGNPLSAIPVNPELRARYITADKASLKSMWDGLSVFVRTHTDPSTAKRIVRAIEIDNWLQKNAVPERKSMPEAHLIFGLAPDREVLKKRISKRLCDRLAAGMTDEVSGLMAEGLSPDRLRFYGLEYLWCVDFLTGKISEDRFVTGLETAIYGFAKRQMTWFRKMEKDGHKIHWLPQDAGPEVGAEIIERAHLGFQQESE